MVDASLVSFAVIVPLVLLGFNLLLLLRYEDASATKGHWGAKLVLLLGFCLAEGTVLLLPLDIGNRAGVVGCGFWNNNCGGLDLVTAWQALYWCIFALIVFIVPFYIFFYEHYDEGMSSDEVRIRSGSAVGAAAYDASDKASDAGSDVSAGAAQRPRKARSSSLRCFAWGNCRQSLCIALCYTLVVAAVVAVILFFAYSYASQIRLPYRRAVVSATTSSAAWANAMAPIDATCGGGLLCPCGNKAGCAFQAEELDMQATFVVYMAAVMSFVGWFVFSIYAGIGFIALPLDCINSWRYRPKVVSSSEAKMQRKVLSARAAELLQISEYLAERLIQRHSDKGPSPMKWSERRAAERIDKQELLRLTALVDMLEKDLEDHQLSDPRSYRQHYNPLVPWAKLLCGIIAVLLSLTWLIHVIVYMVFNPPLHPFLNSYLQALDKAVPFFSTLTIAILVMYLLLACGSGAFKFGTRMFLIKVHPMEPGKTLMNSFFFNLGLILLCTLPVTQFATDAFSQFARASDAVTIFGSQFRYMQGMTYLWRYNVFLFTLLGFALLSILYFTVFPSDRAHLNKVMAEIRKRHKIERQTLNKKIEQRGGAVQGLTVRHWR